ncbi:hypothetical protein, partial [Rhizobium sp. M10]|uniref:hypothetical protein n=1 Tax=Rhizobium sp. M10 TaxID=1324586 RepID=UPI001AEC913B
DGHPPECAPIIQQSAQIEHARGPRGTTSHHHSFQPSLESKGGIETLRRKRVPAFSRLKISRYALALSIVIPPTFACLIDRRHFGLLPMPDASAALFSQERRLASASSRTHEPQGLAGRHR